MTYFDRVIQLIPETRGIGVAYLQHNEDGTLDYWSETVVCWALCDSYDSEVDDREVRALIVEPHFSTLQFADGENGEGGLIEYRTADGNIY